MPAKRQPAKRPKKGAQKRSAAPQGAARSLEAALAEAAWAEADLALAEALVEYDALTAAAKPSERKAALALLGQALGRVARKRGLSRLGDLGKRERYNRGGHDLAVSVVKTPRSVTIKARGVARGNEVLRRPRVSPIAPTPRRKKDQ